MNKVRSYYKVDKTEAIQSAKMGQRVLARLLDLVIAILPGFLIISIYEVVSTAGVTQASLENIITTIGDFWKVEIADLLNGLFVSQYNWVMMLGWGMSILGIIIMFIIIPLFNKKNIGQSFGKWVFKITPLYLTDRERSSFLIRELMMITPLILVYVFIMVGGYSPLQWFSKYTQVKNLNVKLSETSVIPLVLKDLIAEMPSTYSIFDFVLRIGNNPALLNRPAIVDVAAISNAATSSSGVTLIVAEVFKILVIVYWITTMIYGAIGKNGQGPSDLIAKTAIVDLRTITTAKKAESQFLREAYMDH